MTDRERLIELQRKAFREWKNSTIDTFPLEFITDYLLANGVIVPPCKVGDTVYVKWRLHSGCKYDVYPVIVYALRWDQKKNNFRLLVEGSFKISAYGGYYVNNYRATFSWDNIGKTVFLTKEEAEQALKERDG